MVREFQSVIGKEARVQVLEQTGKLPRAIVACIGGGSNAMGIFDAFIDDSDVRPLASKPVVKPSSAGATPHDLPAAARASCKAQDCVLRDEHGNIDSTHSISAGLDYAAIGPEHAWLRAIGRADARTRATRTRLGRSSCSGGSRASCRRSNRRMRSRSHGESRRNLRQTMCCW